RWSSCDFSRRILTWPGGVRGVLLPWWEQARLRRQKASLGDLQTVNADTRGREEEATGARNRELPCGDRQAEILPGSPSVLTPHDDGVEKAPCGEHARWLGRMGAEIAGGRIRNLTPGPAAIRALDDP